MGGGAGHAAWGFRIGEVLPNPSRKDLAEQQSRLSMMGSSALQDFYRSGDFVCRIGPGHFPSARAIDGPVTARKQLRKWR